MSGGDKHHKNQKHVRKHEWWRVGAMFCKVAREGLSDTLYSLSGGPVKLSE